MPATTRNYTAENLFLSLDGVECGFVKSIEGGDISAEVVQEPSGNEYFVKKHLGQPKYEDLLLQIDLSMNKPAYDWIAAFCNGKYARKDITIFTTDLEMRVKTQSDFFNVWLTEATFPAMDSASKDLCYMSLKFAPEYARSRKATGTLTSKANMSKQKRWLPSNFRLEIDGLDCTRVSKVDDFTVKQTTLTNDIGDARDYRNEPGKLEFPNLKITLAEIYAKSWMDWHEDFVIKGNNGKSQEKNGSLSFLAMNLKKELARINFFNLGIFRLAPEKAKLPQDQIKRIIAEMYCERMEFVFPKSQF